MNKKKIKLLILGNEMPNDHIQWINACKRHGNNPEYETIDLTESNWLKKTLESNYNALLAKPSGMLSMHKQLYDERVYILERVLNHKIFPSAEEIFIYENKRFLSSWLEANKIPHPATYVFYNYREASEFLESCPYPVVAKTNIGASGSGVVIMNCIVDAKSYLQQTFHGKGAKQRTGPNLAKGGLLKRGLQYLLHPQKILTKLEIYKSRSQNLQKGFVIFQQYIPHDFEWRVVRIGDSFFAHKKLKIGTKASGSLLKKYDNPPLALFDFVKSITDKYKMFSQAVDLFETEQDYLVNEMQCIFGQSDSYQMLVDGKPGRYRYLNKQWVFEEGDYARNACYDLRLEWVINQIQTQTN